MVINAKEDRRLRGRRETVVTVDLTFAGTSSLTVKVDIFFEIFIIQRTLIYVCIHFHHLKLNGGGGPANSGHAGEVDAEGELRDTEGEEEADMERRVAG